MTTTRCTSDDDDLSMTFRRDANETPLSARIRRIDGDRSTGGRDVERFGRSHARRGDDRSADVVRVEVHSRRDVNAMRSQMRSSLADIRAFLSSSSRA